MNVVWRSWPWTIALAVVLGLFVLLGVVGMGLRTSFVEAVVSAVVTFAAAVGMVRVLMMGVRATPAGLAIRDLTRTTLIAWTEVRAVTSVKSTRRGVYAPVLTLHRPGAAATLEVSVLGSYSEQVARRRADAISAARPDRKPSTTRARRR